MAFLIIGRDGTDENAMERRMGARDAHLNYMKDNLAAGTMIMGAAMLNDEKKMIGSIIMTNHATRAEVDAWLAAEPYVEAKVWESVDVQECAVAPSFQHLVPENNAA